MRIIKIITPLLFIFITSGFSQVYSPNKFNKVIKTLRGDDIVCPGIEGSQNIYIPFAAQSLKSRIQEFENQEKKSHFIVTYNGFPKDAIQAFERAVSIWEQIIYSSVPIRVTANWTELPTDVLGSANTSQWIRDFGAARYVDTYYPIALAEKLAGKPINADSEEDIICNFNKNINWHFDIPDQITGSKYDLTTVVLHELAHGLGFFATTHAENQIGTYGDGRSTFKTIYDLFIENQKGEKLVDTDKFTNNSSALYLQLISNNLFFEKSRSGERPKLYAPEPYRVGSSISHLDPDTYPSKSENVLMAPFISTRSAIHNPGPLAIEMIYKLGWKGTSISHEKIKNRPYIANEPVAFNIKVLSDTTIISESVKLFYETKLGRDSVQLTQRNNSNDYFAEVFFPKEAGQVFYKFEAKDNLGNTVYFPGTDGVDDMQYVYSFHIGEDKTPPVMAHYPLEIIDQESVFQLPVFAEDDFDEEVSIKMNYSINGGQTQSILLEKFNPIIHDIDELNELDTDLAYIMKEPLKGLRVGDHILYQFEGTDLAGNKTVLPTEHTSTSASVLPVSSFYEVTVTGLLGSVNSYSTDFEGNNNDFSTVGFKIEPEQGFAGNALHSSHPYRNGLGLLYPGTNQTVVSFERNEIAMLRKPVILGRGDSRTLSFDEIVLVEPGEEGAAYGSPGLFDYVVVEGLLLGVSSDWFPLEAGYDSREHSSWQQLFESKLSSGDYPNSTAQGHSVFFKKRTIDLSTGGLNRYNGTPMLVRFRLYSDQLVNGWGWAIDNLNIQKEAQLILSTNPENELGVKLFPNPVTDNVVIEAVISGEINLEVYGVDGVKYLNRWVRSETSDFKYNLNLASLSAGVYIVKLTGESEMLYKRFIKL